MKETNQELLRRCTHYNQKIHYLKKVCIQTLFQEDLNKSIPWNKEEFLVEKRILVQTDSYGKVRIDKGPKIYSVGPAYASTKVWVCLGADTVRILDRQFHEIVTHPRLFGSECKESMHWLTYLPLIAKKPRSFPYSGLWSHLQPSLQNAFQNASWKEQKQLLHVLQKTTQEVGFESALKALTGSSSNCMGKHM